MKHKKIMVMGTASGVGKTVLVAGLCRVFYKDRFKIAPFKSQNMALNSYVTKEGDEIGRAQVVQALASGIEPAYYMNPILLKPNGNGQIQVIVNGKSRGNMTGVAYSDYKVELKDEILKAYKNIESNYQIGVIEGAGSPVELNLKENDIANMGVAELLDSPVILVADIDRGGVFASIYGTIQLLEKKERDRVKGIVINKFRGDIERLKSGLDRIEELTGVKVLGVVPYFKLEIEDEDGVTEKTEKVNVKEGVIRVSVIKLKHLSNFTDITPLTFYEDVEINYINSATELGNEDIIVIPGSKNTIEDIKYLKKSGIASEIIKQSRAGKIIIGICGGMQILGDRVLDPEAVEGDIKEISGLALLNLETRLEREKRTTQYSGILKGGTGVLREMKDTEIKGYEIHQGVSYGDEINITDDNRVVAVVKDNIFATYIHGIFENNEFTDYILNLVRKEKGKDEISSSLSYEEQRLRELDRLEKIIRESLDIKRIYEIVGVDRWER